jgi:hypothetical protein
MINKVAVVVTLILILLFGILGWAAFHYYGKYSVELKDNLSLMQDNADSALIISNQATLFNIFNTIAGATHDKQASNTAASQDRQVVIQTIIKTEACATVLVPAAASDVLLKHYNEIRKDAGDADPVQPDSAVPGQPAAK